MPPADSIGTELSAHRRAINSTWSANQYIFALLEGAVEKIAGTADETPRETLTSLQAHLAKIGQASEIARTTYSRITFHPSSGAQRIDLVTL